jgi:hypothetical protein
MKLTLEPTREFFMAGEVMVRMWQGTDGDGAPVIALIAAVALTDGSARPSAFAGLVSIPPPDDESARAWAAEVLSKRRPIGRVEPADHRTAWDYLAPVPRIWKPEEG